MNGNNFNDNLNNMNNNMGFNNFNPYGYPNPMMPYPYVPNMMQGMPMYPYGYPQYMFPVYPMIGAPMNPNEAFINNNKDFIDAQVDAAVDNVINQIDNKNNDKINYYNMPESNMNLNNNQSNRVCEKLNLEYEGIRKKGYMLYDGSIHDIVCYSITDDEFYNRIRKNIW